MQIPRILLGVAAVLAMPAAPGAVVLTFDPVNRNFEHVNQAYGDRVGALPPGVFSYGAAGGLTPNVEVGYGPLANAIPALWTQGYGDLTNILFEDQDSFGRLEVTMTADPGWHVSLASFDLAAYRQVNPIAGVSVRDETGAVIFNQADVTVPHVGHLSFVFDPPLTRQALVIVLETGNLAGYSDDIGIDNIQFSQTVPTSPVDAASWATVKAMYR